MMDQVFKDIRFAFRGLIRNPGFTVTVVLILALGVGATTAIFTMANAAFLRPLPVGNPNELVAVYTTDEKNPGFFSVAGDNFLDFREQSTSFVDLVASSNVFVNMAGEGEPVQVSGGMVTAGYFDLLELRPSAGRFFLPEEDKTPGTHPVMVLSYSSWEGRFGKEPSVIGRELTLNGHVFMVIGVGPEGFQGTEIAPAPEFFVPTMMFEQVTPRPDWIFERRALMFDVIGRLKPGVTIGTAQAEMKTIARNLEAEYPEPNGGRSVMLAPLSRIDPGASAQIGLAMALLTGIAGLVLAIAAANVANLLMVRAAARKREIAVRVSLGAGRMRLVRQLLTESMMLAALGGALGIVIAVWTRELLWSLIPPSPFTIALDTSVDVRVLGFAMLITLASGLFFGIVPAIGASRPNLSNALKSGQQREGTMRRLSLRNTLVVAQVSLSLIALITAGLMMRSIENVFGVDPGFESDKLLTVSFPLADRQYADEARGQAFLDRLNEEIAALPGVELTTVSNQLPMGFGGLRRTVLVEGRDVGEGENGILVGATTVGDRYFEATGIELIRGRIFRSEEPSPTPRVAIINETMAGRFWPGEDPIGRRFTFYGDELTVEVIGIAKDSKYGNLAEDPQPFAYLPLRQSYRDTTASSHLFIRTSGEPLSVAASVRSAIGRIDPNLPITSLRPMNDIIELSMFNAQIGVWLVSAFGFLALLLAGVGVYGVISYSVSQRTHEIGIRMALGARPGDALNMIVRQGIVLSLVGLSIGLAASVGVTRLMSTFLFGVSAVDPVVFVSISLLLAAVAVGASVIPARRATKIDPVLALRFD